MYTSPDIKIKKATRDLKKKRNCFLDEINSKNIYALERDSDNEALYNQLFLKYNFLTGCSNSIELADFDLLITGWVSSKLNGATALISNDFGIQKSWSRLINEERIPKSKYGFYFQKGINFFEKEFFNW